MVTSADIVGGGFRVNDPYGISGLLEVIEMKGLKESLSRVLLINKSFPVISSLWSQ
jgi:hypothetical protein